MNASFEEQLLPPQREVWLSLDSPPAIQAFLDNVPYSAEEANRCPRRVLQDRQAHCLDGGLFAAAALRRLGFPPLIVDLLPDPGMDDDHVLAIYRVDGCYGALAKSNYVGLRYREPIYRSLRELAMSYFEQYFNLHGVKSLRAYTRPLNLRTLDKYAWMTSDAGADRVEQRLKELRPVRLLTPEQSTRLSPVDPRSYEANTLGINPEGVYTPRNGS